MERENFYQVLELSVNPPESDQKKIEEAIKKKQAEWSRYRNHPTKAVLAKHYIDLIPEIRRVMLDPSLRPNEARQAKIQFQNKVKQKYLQIDRHLEIRMSKGFITDEEVFKLAKLHSVSEKKIRDRINAKLKEKYSRIDKQIEIRMSKGFIAEEEIAKLAKLHTMSEDEIRKRITCPIKKNYKVDSTQFHQLDKSIEKVIHANLKIVGKSSLYDFLGLSNSSSLEAIQKRTKEKETELLKIIKKDAVVTASGILVGQCIAVFKTQESRNAYNISIARSHLDELNSDIEVAGMDGKIRTEYFEALVKAAVKFGMDRDEACQYIKEYCREKKWNIETEKTKKHFRLPTTAIFATVIITVVITATIVWAVKSQHEKKEYQRLLVEVDNQNVLEEKISIIKKFSDSYSEGSYALKAEKMIIEIQNIIEERDYKSLLHRADILCTANNYTEATAVCKQYLEKYPNGIYKAKISSKMEDISVRSDDRDYEKLNTAIDFDSGEKIAVYMEYLNNHPKGKYRDKVNQFIADMQEEYYIFLKEKIFFYGKQEKWKICAQLCDNFIKIYDSSQHAEEIKSLQASFQKKLYEQKILANLMLKAEHKGNHYEAAKQIYLDYLKAYPNTSLKKKLNSELAKIQNLEDLDRKAKEKERLRALLKSAGGIFVEKKDGTITDTRTGLVWCMLDSNLELKRLIDYEFALQYVKSLRTGGYNDWRLPTVGELEKIYKRKPFFPSVESKEPVWYWTSENYACYSDGWSKVVDVVSSQKETSWNKDQKDCRQLGAVRAVRP
ncbi:MAG: DUF1566 domain-containing protein [Desulfobacterales bacterium]|nr:DUF1566 domain-containing protein [Desulfobacterales bacterium]